MGSQLSQTSFYYQGTSGEEYNDFVKFSCVHPLDCPRFRAWEVGMEEPYIAIRGRCGAGNREDYEKEIEYMESNSTFISSEEMWDDRTYMVFYYKIDDNYIEDWKNFVEKYKNSEYVSKRED